MRASSPASHFANEETEAQHVVGICHEPGYGPYTPKTCPKKQLLAAPFCRLRNQSHGVFLVEPRFGP